MRHSLFLLFVLCQFYAGAQIVNIESLRMDTDSNGVSGRETFLFNITQNTRQLISLNNNFSLQWKRDRHLILFLNDINLTFSENTDFERKGFFHLRYNYELNSHLTLEAFSQYQVDIPLKIESRMLLGAGPRVELLEKDSAQLVWGTLLMYEYDSELDNGIVHRDFRLSSYLSFGRILQNFRINSLTYYQPRLDYFRDFRLSSQLQIEFRLLKSLWFAINGGLYYDAFPVNYPSIPNLTYKIANGLTYTF